MSVLFGGNLADELAETVRQYKEEFDSIDIDTHLQNNQWKNRSAEIIAQQKQDSIHHEPHTKSSLSKSLENPSEQDVNAFIGNDDSEDDDLNSDSNDHPHKDSNDEDIEYLDVREQTIFRYSNKPRISKYDKNKNAKASSLAYIQNNNVRTSFKNTSNAKKMADGETYFAKDPFMDQKLLRQNFVIDRRRKDFSMIKDKSRIGKLARHNMQFIKEVLTSKEIEMKKNLVFDKRQFNRKLRFTLGAPNKRRQRNYREFQ
eukprot:355737_1